MKDLIITLSVTGFGIVFFLIGWTAGYKQGHRDGFRWGKSVKASFQNASI